MAGLRTLCKAAGSMTINGTKYVWDYAADEPVKQSEMPMGSDRWKASQKARAALLRAKIAQEERT